ncbi:MAG TPA: caspase family protein [Coleofasciculaceae cyanobacterium]
MTNHWAIAIGINQYRYFQPLTYAERDAQLFRDFLVKEAGVSSKHCLLLTDTSPAIEHTATYPSRDIIQAYITQLCQKRLQPGDFLWCFFSGYGVRFEGKDYLMPADGKPDAIANTGIPIEFLFNTFAAAPTSNVLLTLDVNRSQSVLAGEGVGDQTVLLAKEYGIPAILSAQPDQFSHETLALRQGLFTAALIEALRYRGCVTVEQLAHDLDNRLPELSEHHWRPRQEPFAVIPNEKKHQLILPEPVAATLGAAESRLSGAIASGGLPTADFGSRTDATALLERSLAAPFPSPALPTGLMPIPPTLLPVSPPVVPQTNASAHSPAADSRMPEWQRAEASAPLELAVDAQFWKKLMVWGGAIAAILLLSVVVRNWQKLTEPPAPVPTGAASASAQAVKPNEAINPASPLGSVQIALQSGQYEEAKRQLQDLPAEQQDATYLSLMEQANRGLLSDARTILSRSRDASAENQASDFADAIAKARQIKLGQPLFEEAHQDIDRWSRVILDMAQGRADRRNGSSTPTAANNYSAAIASAQLVPNDNPQIYAQAQQAIAQWSQLILALANERAQENNYDLAIKAAELIPQNAPSYAEAQEAIAQWSKQSNP